MDNITSLPSYKEMKRHQREVIENGFIFPLNASSIGKPDTIHVRVRRLSTVDRAAINALPQDMQQTIFKGIKELQRVQKENNNQEPEDILEMLANNEDILKTANAWCLASFIYPRLVESASMIPDESESGEVVWALDAVHEEDRIALLLAAMDADSAQNKKLKMFRPTWGNAAQDRPALSVASETERALGPELAGV